MSFETRDNSWNVGVPLLSHYVRTYAYTDYRVRTSKSPLMGLAVGPPILYRRGVGKEGSERIEKWNGSPCQHVIAPSP